MWRRNTRWNGGATINMGCLPKICKDLYDKAILSKELSKILDLEIQGLADRFSIRKGNEVVFQCETLDDVLAFLVGWRSCNERMENRM